LIFADEFWEGMAGGGRAVGWMRDVPIDNGWYGKAIDRGVANS
jgi:hypothetical protein